MKKSLVILFCLVFWGAFSQNKKEKIVKTKVNEVTVFLKGAQIIRKSTVDISKGKSIIKFVNLSPFIDAKSIQIKAMGDIRVLSVNHQKNFINKTQKSKEIESLLKKKKILDEKINLEETYLSIISEELSFLNVNRNISGKNNQLTLLNLKQTAEYYSKRLTSLKLKQIEKRKNIKKLEYQKRDINKQIESISGKKEFPSGEILVKVETKYAKSYKFELNYLVNNAGWYPTYDIRAKDINKPLELVYKANLKQDTKVDWTNVKLKFSSADPSYNSVIPEFETYFLDYTYRPKKRIISNNSVQGVVVDNEGLPLPGVSVIVDGTTIGTSTDLDGKYSISLPLNANQLKFSFIGFTSQTKPILSSKLNVKLNPDKEELEEVVITGYGKKGLFSRLKGKVAGVRTKQVQQSKRQLKKSYNKPALIIQKETQTTVNFEIKTPYTIKSDNKNYSINMQSYNLPANYQYFSFPKFNKDAFLLANITDWQKYNLLDGMANIFFEGTFIGKTVLDLRNTADTLKISLGSDKKVYIKREKIKDFTNKQFIGNKKEETRAWKLSVRNNKNQPIQLTLIDQIPISGLEEIKVMLHSFSGAEHKKETGKLIWKLKLNPKEKKEFELKYSVKYPKYRNLIIE